MAFNNRDDYLALSPLRELIERFIFDKISTHTGLNLVQFLKLPKHWIEMVFESCDKLNKIEASQVNDLEQSFKQAKNQMNENKLRS